MIYPIERITGSTGGIGIGIGGGAYHKTFVFRAVLKFHPDGYYQLKPAVFIRENGDRACRRDQGIVPVEIGDLIIEGFGSLPINPNNPGITIRAERVIAIEDGHIITNREEDYPVDMIPTQVITGASLYHNRDGSYFCEGII